VVKPNKEDNSYKISFVGSCSLSVLCFIGPQVYSKTIIHENKFLSMVGGNQIIKNFS
jgi:hypothetical protein